MPIGKLYMGWYEVASNTLSSVTFLPAYVKGMKNNYWLA